MKGEGSRGQDLEQPAQLWIDARRVASGWRLWGMNLVERQVREAGLRHLSTACVWVSPQSERAVRRLRPDLSKLYSVAVEVRTDSIVKAMAGVEVPLLLLDGDVVYDDRVFDHLLQRGPGNVVRSDEGGVAGLVDADQARRLAEIATAGGVTADAAVDVENSPIGNLVDRHSRVLNLATSTPEDLDQYVPSLRLTMAPYLVRLTEEEQLPALDKRMYRRTFKGVIDVVALYGYYHLVRWITRHLSRTSLTPNLLTVLSILGIWAAIPCFAAGDHGWGISLAWIGVILDSVDGKLARLRLHLSDAMGSFEHLAAMPGLGLWYLSLGWYFSDGALTTTRPIAIATWALLGSYLVDKGISGGFVAFYKQRFFDYGPIDAAFHLVACRRNTALLIYSIGYFSGAAKAAFYAIVVWMAVAVVFHGVRFGWIAITDGPRLRRVSVNTPVAEEVRGKGAGA